MTNEIIPAAERIQILTGRIKNLKAGKGNHPAGHRSKSIRQAEEALKNALLDLEATPQ